jgi:hypothetical protein
MLSLVVAGSAGCAGGRPAVEPAGHAAPTRTAEVIKFPVGSWRRLPSSPPVRLEVPAIGVSSPLVRLTCAGSFDRERHSYRDNLVVSAVRVADGRGATEAGR